ncbi:MAG: ZrgA family zinc uptake protein, partial [Burkholderiaceae bacterium]
MLAAVSLTVSSLALADGHGHSHPHAHGQANAEVSLQGKVLKVEIRGAMDNFLSFEHAPKTDAQRAQLKALRDQLKDAGWLVVPAAQAQCKVTSV